MNEAVEHASAPPGSVLLLTRDVVRAGRTAHTLTAGGLLVTVAFDEGHALACLRDLRVQVLVVDIAALQGAVEPGLRALRRATPAVVLALAVPGAVGLERLFAAGVAAVVSVDASPTELVGQVRALLGLGDPCDEGGRRQLSWGPIRIDQGHRAVVVDGRDVALTPLQLRLLTILVNARGDVVSHGAIYRMLWRCPVDDDGQRLSAHVHRLRERLGGADGAGGCIVTVRGVGYRMAEPVGQRPIAPGRCRGDEHLIVLPALGAVAAPG